MAASPAVRLLLIEDDVPLASLMLQFLRQYQYDVTHVIQAEKALALSQDKQFQLIICDIMLPGQCGFTALEKLRQHFNCPVIFLTALDTDQDQIRGLELGACDYIVKPVQPAVLLARIKLHLRSLYVAAQSSELELHDLKLDRQQQKLWLKSQPIELTTKEFSMLWIFVSNHGKVLSREFMFSQLVGRPYDGLDRAIDAKISRFRKKMESLAIPGLSISTVHGQGYLFCYCPPINTP